MRDPEGHLPLWCSELPYGFEYGSLTITRVASCKRRGWVVVEAKTPRSSVQIYATGGGKMRFFADGGEYVLAKKPKARAVARGRRAKNEPRRS